MFCSTPALYNISSEAHGTLWNRVTCGTRKQVLTKEGGGGRNIFSYCMWSEWNKTRNK